VRPRKRLSFLSKAQALERVLHRNFTPRTLTFSFCWSYLNPPKLQPSSCHHLLVPVVPASFLHSAPSLSQYYCSIVACWRIERVSTSSYMIPPEETPEYTSELNILSPVSPKPVHYPVPSNIVVLEKQIDPVFNQTNTHIAVAAQPAPPPPPPPPPAMYLNHQESAYNHQAQNHDQHQHHPQQPNTNQSEAYMTQQAGQDGQAYNLQAYSHQAQEQAHTRTDSRTNQVSPVVLNDDKYFHQPAAPAVAASSDASAPASVHPDIFHPSAAAHSLPALSHISANEASFQSNSSFHAQAQPSTQTANANVTELPPGVEANSLQSLLNNLSQPATNPNPQLAQPPASATAPAFEQTTPQREQAWTDFQSAHVGANGLPPPPLASFQQSMKLESQRERKQAAGEVLDEDDQPWTPETQHRYDNFLTEERKYVTEGNWEQFPYGSRLFVGNLSSERVTKRDIFHVFHKYGDLAQISIKQAYGFVQFLESNGCSKAINAEQGKTIRGKKIRKSAL
jgi:nuclear polyadenylated RNA-binding protein 3